MYSSKWFRTMDRYLPCYSGSDFFPSDDVVRSYSLDYIKTIAIPHIDQRIELPEDLCAAYSAILSLLRFPQELQVLRDTSLLSKCSNHLREYINQTKRSWRSVPTLFSHESGFLCFRVIVLLLQVGILLHTDTLDQFLKEVSSGESDPYQIAVTLSEFTMGLLLSKDNSSPRDWLLAASSLQTAGRRTFLKSVGGFDNADAEDLLKLIWKDRNRFLEISSRIPTPGWALLLLILGEHMQWKSEVDGICLVASASELKALETFCLDCVQDRPDPGEGLDDIYYEGSLANVHDARTFH
ncbi:unnamed protein product [Rhizoctonia solani]|uniref:Uncharacterized protein n=1 Tax=Rhizoctonia solani TaxID=456999 RepID=A0A8H3A9J5_9AGAM|nr:unnamed protein product [Rhizoctonia solani]